MPSTGCRQDGIRPRPRYRSHGLSPTPFGNCALRSFYRPQASESEHEIQLSLPHWLSSKTYDFLVLNSYSGFQFTMRVYSIVPDDSPAFVFASTGNLAGLQDLFHRGLASPFDRTSRNTLLQVRVPPLPSSLRSLTGTYSYAD